MVELCPTLTASSLKNGSVPDPSRFGFPQTDRGKPNTPPDKPGFLRGTVGFLAAASSICISASAQNKGVFVWAKGVALVRQRLCTCASRHAFFSACACVRMCESMGVPIPLASMVHAPLPPPPHPINN